MGMLYWEPRDLAGKVCAGHFRTTVNGKLLIVWRRAERQWQAEIYTPAKKPKKLAINGFNKRGHAADWAIVEADAGDPLQTSHSFGNYANTVEFLDARAASQGGR
jgi:shikimate kinase